MTQHSFEHSRESAQEFVTQRLDWIHQAVDVVTGDPNISPLEAFPAPTEPRAAAEGLLLTSEQEKALREIAGRFGIGGEADVIIPTESTIIEGGKPWKIEAEASIAPGDTLYFAGSAHRIIGEDEVEYIRSKFGIDMTGKTEYEAAHLIAANQPDFRASEARVQPYGYDIHNEFAFRNEPTGQLVLIGTASGRQCVLLRVDREDYEVEGKRQYRNQPDSAELMRFISRTLRAQGNDNSGVGLVTSSTYASRTVDTFRTGLDEARFFGISMYGRETLAHVRGQEQAEPSPINQIPGELHVMYQKLSSLHEEITS